MIWSAGEDRQRLGRALLIASILSVSAAEAQVGRAADDQDGYAGVQTSILKREASVFTYRQFTSQLPPLSSSGDSDPVAVSSLSLPIKPLVPASALPVGQDQAGLMGRFGQTVDAGSAQNSRTATLSEHAEQPSGEPGTTVTAADQQPVLNSQSEKPAEAKETKLIARGRASWYRHPGRTANGEPYNPNMLTAAHHTLPFGTRVKVVNNKNGKSVIVRVTDRTNEHTKAKRNYIIDLSRASAGKIGIDGIGMVALYKAD